MFDMAAAADEVEEVLVEGISPESYLEHFAWDEAKYPPRRPLKETVAAITETVSMLEDRLKVQGLGHSCCTSYRNEQEITPCEIKAGTL